MSQLTALPRPSAKAAQAARSTRPATSQTPRLRVVQTTDAAEHTGVGFVLLCVLLLVSGLIALLLLNTNRAQQSFAIQKLQAKSASLTDQAQQLHSSIDAQAAPQQLALQAQRLGLKPATKVRYVRKSDGTVLGVAKRSAKAPAFTVGTLPSTPASRAAGEAVGAASAGLLVIKPLPAVVQAKSDAPAKSTAGKKSSKDTKKTTGKSQKQTATSKSTKDHKPTSTTKSTK